MISNETRPLPTSPLSAGLAMVNRGLAAGLACAASLCFGLAALADSSDIDPASGNAQPSVAELAAQGYSLVWSDEFNGDSLDRDKWGYRTDSKSRSTQKAENVSVAHGSLCIALKKEPAPGKKAADLSGGGDSTEAQFGAGLKRESEEVKSYTAGGVISKKEFQYGYYEARLRVPPGAGWHTAFWTIKYNGHDTNPNFPEVAQELDICEQDSENLHSYNAGVHGWGTRNAKGLSDDLLGCGRHGLSSTPDLSAEFHVWGCEFTPTVVNFYFDGKLTHSSPATGFKHGPQNIWLTVLAYKNKKITPPVDDSKLPAASEFDYVRFFAKTPQKQ